VSSNPLPEVSVADQDFARIWAESATGVLEQLHGSPFMATPQAPGEEAPSNALWLRFKTSGRLSGELAIQISRPDGVRLSQLLKAEPLDPTMTFDEGRADALGEIFRQFAGLASTSCRSAYGGEVQFSLDASSAPAWQPAGVTRWMFAAAKVDPVFWTLTISPELHASLTAPPRAAQPQAPAPASFAAPSSAAPQFAVPSFAPAAASPSDGSAPSNLDLLLDVELEASLRFGQREMLLRDILELHPGSVVELDRRVQEPAELIVSGRVIAHGEVVIVDGNYGLRITNIAQPGQRLQSLET
jgi:flagellar motor switch protein FliN